MGSVSPLQPVFFALANDDRLAILEELSRAGAEVGGVSELSISEVARRTELTRFSASRHLAILHDAELLSAGKSGLRTLYRLEMAGFERVEDWLYPLVARVLTLADRSQHGMDAPAPRRIVGHSAD